MKLIEKMWLIDDDFLFRTLAEILINEKAMAKDVVLFEDAPSAIENLKKEERPDLIFLDLNMPTMSGWEFLDEVLEKNLIDFNRTKVYILSSSIDPRDIQRAKRYKEIQSFIPKPLTNECLEQVCGDLGA